MFEFLDEETKEVKEEAKKLASEELLVELEKMKENLSSSSTIAFVSNSSPTIIIKQIHDRFHAGANDVYVLNGGIDHIKFEVFNFIEVENLLLKAYIAGEFQTAPLGWFVEKLSDDQLKKLVV